MMAELCALRLGVLCALLCASACVSVDADLDPVRPESAVLKPRVMIAVLARNSAHSLPHFLGCIDRLEYPKERMAICLHSGTFHRSHAHSRLALAEDTESLRESVSVK